MSRIGTRRREVLHRGEVLRASASGRNPDLHRAAIDVTAPVMLGYGIGTATVAAASTASASAQS